MLADLALMVNPTSGKGRGATVAQPVVDRLQRLGVSVRQIVGRDADDARQQAEKAVADGVGALVALGGDGMVHLAVQVVAGTSTPLGVIPAGTGNDLAAGLGLPIGDPLAAAEVVARGALRSIDAVDCGERWFACVLGAGFDSATNERANAMTWPRGPRRYDLAMLMELRTYRPTPFVITLDGERVEQEAMLVAVGNARSYGAGMQVCPDAELDDGLLDVMILTPVSKPTFVRMFPSVYKGTHVRHPSVQVRRATSVTLESPGVVSYADGERFLELPLTATCRPGALQVLTP